MHRFLERLDGMASTIVPLAYLAALAIGTAAYFTGITLDVGYAVGIALAIAAELHAFLSQRRVRALWAAYVRASVDDAARAALRIPLRVAVAILLALTAFSTFNSLAFVAATFHPVPGFLPGWIQIAIRGSVVPAFFLLAGFLSPLHSDAGEVLASASDAMLHRAVRATVKQWRTRIDRAKRAGLDLAPVAVALMEDAGDADGARRIRLIAAGLDTAEGRTPPASTPPAVQLAAPVTIAEAAPDPTPPEPSLSEMMATLAAAVSALPVAIAEAIPAPPPTPVAALPAPETPETPEAPERPPTGPGSPVPVTRRQRKRSASGKAGKVITLETPPEWRKNGRQAASGRSHPSPVRTLPKTPAKERAIAAWVDGMSVSALMRAAGVSKSTAARYRAEFASNPPTVPAPTPPPAAVDSDAAL